MNDSEMMKSIILGSLAADEIQETGNVSEGMQEVLSSLKSPNVLPESGVKADKYIEGFCRSFFEMEEHGDPDVQQTETRDASIPSRADQNELKVHRVTKTMCPTSLSEGEFSNKKQTRCYDTQELTFSSTEELIQAVLNLCGHSAAIEPIVQRTKGIVSLQFFCDSFGEQIVSSRNLSPTAIVNHISIECNLA